MRGDLNKVRNIFILKKLEIFIDKKNGEGQLILVNGDIFKGKWDNGNIIYYIKLKYLIVLLRCSKWYIKIN